MHIPHHFRNLALTFLTPVTVVIASATSALADPDPPSRNPWGWGGEVGGGSQPQGRPGHIDDQNIGGSGTEPADNNASGDDGGCPAVQPDPNVAACYEFGCGPFGEIGGCQPPDGPPAPAITPLDLLQQAMYELRPPKPRVMTAPPRGADGMVGLAEWFWLDPAQRKPISVRRSAGGVWVELTATVQSMTITPGAGLPLVACPVGGSRYRPGARPDSSSCTYTYGRSSAGQPGGAYRVTATVIWGGTWRGSGGVNGELTPLPIVAGFGARIGEGQALNEGRR